MFRSKINILLVLFIGLTLFAGSCDDNKNDEPNLGTGVGDKAMNITGYDQDGNAVNLVDYEGNVILLDFSTRWCVPCQEEAANAEALYQKYKDRGFIIITVLVEGRNEGVESTPEDLKAWIQQYGLTFPVINDPDKVAWNNYKDVNNYPLNIVIDRDRIIKYKNQLKYDEAAIEDAIISLL